MDTELAKSEADVLHHVITSKRFDDDKVIHILSTRNFYQLRLTFECYRNKHANSIEQVHLLHLIVDILYTNFFPP